MCPSVSKPELLRALVESAEPAELPALAGELARSLADVLARTAARTEPVAVDPTRDRTDNTLLAVGQAAERLGVPPSWLYRHWQVLPFARKLGHRTLRFDSPGLDRWLRGRSRV